MEISEAYYLRTLPISDLKERCHIDFQNLGSKRSQIRTKYLCRTLRGRYQVNFQRENKQNNAALTQRPWVRIPLKP